VPSLIAKSPLAGRFPVSHGGLALSEVPIDRMTSIAPLKGKATAVAKVLKAAGLAFPAPNTWEGTADRMVVWTARQQAFVIGPLPEGLAPLAALTDQSDGWARLRLEGAGAAEALMRLVPLDLRRAATGWAARAPLNHMQSVLICPAPGVFDVLVFRSMAVTAWAEIEEAMQSLAARARRRV
jgi:heterotetrameric sarcosine oxidase gamma subunit